MPLQLLSFIRYLAICFLIVLIFYLNIDIENFYYVIVRIIYSSFQNDTVIYRLVSCFSRIRYTMPVNSLLYNELIKFRK